MILSDFNIYFEEWRGQSEINKQKPNLLILILESAKYTLINNFNKLKHI